MKPRKSRREVQREFTPGTLFSYYDSSAQRCRIAMIVWWTSIKTSTKHPASWIAKCLAEGTIVKLHWERFNDEKYIEVLGHGEEKQTEAA